MKRILLLFLTLCSSSLLIAQEQTTKTTKEIPGGTKPLNKVYIENFDKVESEYIWRKSKDCVVKDGVYQVTSPPGGKSDFNPPMSYYPFNFKKGQDWVFEVSMKKIAGNPGTEWGIELGNSTLYNKLHFRMNKYGASSSFTRKEFNVKNGFNDLKMVKTGDSLDVYFNGKLLGSGSLKKLQYGNFYFSMSADGGPGYPVIVQYDNIRFEITKEADEPVEIAINPSFDTKISIPDANFKAALIAAGVDINKDGEIQKDTEAPLVTEINVYDMKVASLEGIQYFENLLTLNCASNNIAAIDLTKNTKLTSLFCKANKIALLNLSKNIQLKKVVCGGNMLTSLSVSENKMLDFIECNSNQLTELNVSGNVRLKWLDCRSNKLIALNVTKCSNLITLKCESNLLKKIQVSPTFDEEFDEREKWTKDATAEWAESTF